ncbi:DNA mismatch repair endonuclease MutL [Phormidium sp. CCY1219]|uniref:DNA mismatch repair endonuclease MutL n=1 Tax=Phormidium sp. CCY1219 TaxID=2886104 RepID=UPI002D1F4E93|nr:DNA mismatch repair endonuclease MutL [Phormidium sp. CCY1219]MEB3829462.1 DNA mismatch repair endonuclease MutL [Phormidium sp. CCY1219]
MSNSIQTLPAEVVYSIAAGETIDSLAAVLRELLENALDAGATRIAISLWPELWRVRVADNGCGMDLQNLKLAATAHSTSKIHQVEDLWKITSLGFRGEALHSLAHLSSLEIFSRTAGGEGWRVLYNAQGEAVEIEPTAIAPGTIVTVSDLFERWKPRRQSLPSRSQQLKTVQQTIQHIALCHPLVHWQVEHNDRSWFRINPGQTAQNILPQILRTIAREDLAQLKLEVEGEQQIQVVLGLPDRCHRRRSDWVKVAVNGRLVRSPELEQTIVAGFARTLPRDRYPICFLHLRLTADQIDWNRHPAKAEIYLKNMGEWQNRVSEAIGQALRLNPEATPDIAQERVNKLLKAAEPTGSYHVSPTPGSEPERTRESEAHPLIPLRAVAQVNQTYIVAEHPGGLWLVEQHIAHERILYEDLCDRWEIVPLKSPVAIGNLKPTQIECLEEIGLEVSPFGTELWAIRSAPKPLVERDDCADALVEISLGGDLQTAQVAIACRTAIRNGTPLSVPQMQDILDRWQRTRTPRTCPHGRPIYLALEEPALARFFRRSWVIGKSHGI